MKTQQMNTSLTEVPYDMLYFNNLLDDNRMINEVYSVQQQNKKRRHNIPLSKRSDLKKRTRENGIVRPMRHGGM